MGLYFHVLQGELRLREAKGPRAKEEARPDLASAGLLSAESPSVTGLQGEPPRGGRSEIVLEL